MNIKCDICGKNEASVHLTEVVNGKVSKIHICDECAKSKSDEMQAHFGLTDLLSGLMDFAPIPEGGKVHEKSTVKCGTCGMTYYDFQKEGRLGCGRCYETFEKNLSDLLRKIHGSDKHLGKIPFMDKFTEEQKDELKRFKEELEELIRSEEFEKAALLRDRIKDLEKELNGEEADQ